VIAMKKLILLFLVAAPAFASVEKGTITVKLDNGTVREYPADKYLVVKRRTKKVVVVAKAATTSKSTSTTSDNLTVTSAHAEAVPAPAEGNRRNRVRLMAGLGPNGVKVEGGPTQYLVSPAQKLVGGVGYSRLLTDRWSVDAQALTNKTYTLGLGFDF